MLTLKRFHRSLARLLSLLIVISGLTLVPVTAGAAVLPDGYEEAYNTRPYQSLGILEDQYDLIEPVNNRYPCVSPNRDYDKVLPTLVTGTYEEVEQFFKEHNMTDGLPVVPPTKIKAEKFMGYSSYGFDDPVATIDGKQIKAYQVAANAIMAGCSPEDTPVCIAFAQALSDENYLNSLRSGKLTPMLYVNGPMARQIGIDNAQGMTAEERNIGIGRFMELALINLAGIERDRTSAFGNVQPLVFSENDEVCLNIGWNPHHVEKGYDLNDNIITATSFAMWGNNVTPATDLPDEIMKVLAWDITEKNLGALGSASIDENANTKRLILITESVAAALSAKFSSKSNLEDALIETARRPLWMRAYAYYYANTGGALSKSFETVYSELKAAPNEDAKTTASPAWMNGITYSEIDTVATMKKGNTDIIITGDSSRNKTQVMPGGVSVNREIHLSDRWNALTGSVNYNPVESFYLSEQNHTITPPASVPSVLTNGTYRILDPATGATYLTRAGRVYYENDTNILHYYAQGASGASSVVLDPETDTAFIAYLTKLGYNSSFTVSNGKLTEAVIRFSSNASKPDNNTVALTNESFSGIALTLHANNQSGSNLAGGLAKDGATVTLSDTVTSFTANLNGDIVKGESTDASFITLSGSTVTVNPEAKAGAAAVIGAANADGTYRTMTFVNGGDGTYTVTYNTANTLSVTTSPFMLKGAFNEWSATDAFKKTANSDIISIKKELAAGTYEFKLHNLGADKWYGKDSAIVADTTYRTILTQAGGNLVLNATGGKYEFKFELSTNKLSVYHASSLIESEEPTTEDPAAFTALLGDATGDGRVNIRDVTAIQRHVAELEFLNGIRMAAADVNGSQNVTVLDATELQCYLAEFAVSYPIGETFCYSEEQTQPATAAPATVTPTTAAPTTASSAYTVVFSNALGWSGNISCYYWADGYNPVEWPGTQMTYLGTNSYGQKQYTLTIPARAKYVIFTNGSAQTIDLPISGNTNYYTKNETENGKYQCGTW